LVVFSFGSDEAYGAPDHGVSDVPVEIPLAQLADIADDPSDQVFELVTAAKNLSSSEAAAGKMRLERLDETPLLLRMQISFDGLGARVGVGSLRSAR
jgi:hypothetical protein